MSLCSQSSFTASAQCFCLAGFTGTWAEAQTQTRQLPIVPGLTEIQKPVAAAVDTACQTLTGLSTPTTEQAKLLDSCRKMVQTANQLAKVTFNKKFSLDLTNDQLRDAVQAIGNEEVATNGRSAVETAGGSAIGIRLFALRNGARGFGMVDAGSAAGANTKSAALRESGGGAADEPGGRIGGFLNVSHNKGDKATTTREDGFDFDNTGFTTGLDYRFNDNFAGGAALSYGKTDATIASALGTADSQSSALSLYASWYLDKWFVDGHLSYSRNRYDTVRNIVVVTNSSVEGFRTAALGNTNGNQFTAVVGTGYDIERGNLLITPYGRIGALRLRINAYSETEPTNGLALDVGAQSLKSVQSAFGAKIALTSSTAVGVVVPFVSMEWNHEFANDTRNLTAKYTNDPTSGGNFFASPTDTPDRNYATLSIGASAQFRNGFSSFATLSTVEGLKDVKNRGIVVGLRKEF